MEELIFVVNVIFVIGADLLRGIQRAITHLNGVRAPRDLNNWRVVEVGGKPGGVDSGRGDDDFEVWTSWQQLFQVTQQEVDIEAALVSLVNNDGVMGAQVAIVGNLSKQYSVSHDSQCGVGGSAPGEAHLIADLFPQLDPHFLGNSFCDAARGDPSGLGMGNLTTSQGQADLGQLGRLSRTGLACHHHDLVVLDEVSNLVGVCRYRKVSVEGDDSPTRQLTFQS